MTAGGTRLLLLVLCALAADVPAGGRAETNYLLHCRGCHGPEGMGSPGSVPRLSGFVGRFLAVEGGREFLVQVPGAANAPVDDASLAELLNWMLEEFSPAELPVNYRPFTATEVAGLRARPLLEVAALRERLVARMPES